MDEAMTDGWMDMVDVVVNDMYLIGRMESYTCILSLLRILYMLLIDAASLRQHWC